MTSEFGVDNSRPKVLKLHLYYFQNERYGFYDIISHFFYYTHFIKTLGNIPVSSKVGVPTVHKEEID